MRNETVGWREGVVDGAVRLALVRVSVEWERPTWRVSWQDGPTREALMGRAAALGRYRVGAPLPFEELRFARSHSAVAVALAWLARGSPQSPAAARAAVAEVEVFCANTGLPDGGASRTAPGGTGYCQDCGQSARMTER